MRLILLEVGVGLSDKQERVVHQILLSHKADVLQDLLANISHVFTAEAQEFFVLADGLQIDIFQAVLHRERLVHLTIDDAAL